MCHLLQVFKRNLSFHKDHTDQRRKLQWYLLHQLTVGVLYLANPLHYEVTLRKTYYNIEPISFAKYGNYHKADKKPVP